MRKDKSPISILVVEDNPGDYTLIIDYLEEMIENPATSHVKSYGEAKEMLTDNTHKFDVVLLDLSLPDKTGESLITGIIELAGDAPVIVLTGYADIEFSIKSLSLKVSDYLLKDDINASSLYKSIKYNIERKKSSLLLEESEKRYSYLFQLSPQPMWVFDMDNYRFIQANKAAIDHYGFTEAEFLQMKLFDIITKEDADVLKAKPEDRSLINANIYKGRFLHFKKSKEEITVDVYSSLLTINEKEYQLAINIDVTDKIQYEQRITKAIIQAQENERYEIGAELHDNVCQILATSQLSLDLLSTKIPETSMASLNTSKQYINLALEEIRKISHRLAPSFFNETTIEDSLIKLLNSINVNNRYSINLNYDASLKKLNLKRDLLINIYRITQEQLNNISKYAKASKIDIQMTVLKNKLYVSISDNGIGFDVEKNKRGIGFSNIKRRVELFNGALEIISAEGKGCEITLSIPLKEIVIPN